MCSSLSQTVDSLLLGLLVIAPNVSEAAKCAQVSLAIWASMFNVLALGNCQRKQTTAEPAPVDVVEHKRDVSKLKKQQQQTTTYPTRISVPDRSQVSRPGVAFVSVMILAWQLLHIISIGYGPKASRTITVVVVTKTNEREKDKHLLAIAH